MYKQTEVKYIFLPEYIFSTRNQHVSTPTGSILKDVRNLLSNLCIVYLF